MVRRLVEEIERESAARIHLEELDFRPSATYSGNIWSYLGTAWKYLRSKSKVDRKEDTVADVDGQGAEIKVTEPHERDRCDASRWSDSTLVKESLGWGFWKRGRTRP